MEITRCAAQHVTYVQVIRSNRPEIYDSFLICTVKISENVLLANYCLVEEPWIASPNLMVMLKSQSEARK